MSPPGFDLLQSRLRFIVRVAGSGETLTDRMVYWGEATQAAEEQSELACAALDRGLSVELLVLDPDGEDRIVFRAVWEP